MPKRRKKYKGISRKNSFVLLSPLERPGTKILFLTLSEPQKKAKYIKSTNQGFEYRRDGMVQTVPYSSTRFPTLVQSMSVRDCLYLVLVPGTMPFLEKKRVQHMLPVFETLIKIKLQVSKALTINNNESNSSADNTNHRSQSLMLAAAHSEHVV